MLSWNDLKNLDVTDIDLTKIDLTRLDIRNVEMPAFEMPTFEMPAFDMPAVELPADVERVADFARDAVYAGVGVAVLTVQKLEAQRRELAEQVTAQLRRLVDVVA